MPSILIAGPPGAGKSSAGRALAERLALSWIDLDDAIERKTRRSPATIIQLDGESVFRSIEAATLEMLDPHGVVSLGGGTLTTDRGRKAARSRGAVMGLTAGVDTLAARIRTSGADRPLLAGDERSASQAKPLSDLLDDRKKTYAAVDRRISAEGELSAVVERLEESARGLELLFADVGGQKTRVLVGSELEDAFSGAVAALAPSRPVLILADRGVPIAKRDAFIGGVRAHFATHVIEVAGGEEVKTWAFLGEVLESALGAGCGRQSAVAAVGGGATCDLAALAASLLGRGAPVVLAPSTLLAQVDASIGGKCAVNMGAGRNLAGVFHPATDVIIDVTLLDSLSESEYRSGLAELLKIALISDHELFDELITKQRVSSAAIARAVRAKADIVARDPFEKGERKLLNLGHTLGHALESASGFTLRHGEAVAVGIAAVCRYSAWRGWLGAEVSDYIVSGLERVGLPTTITSELLSRSYPYLERDKKGDGRMLDLVCVQELGKVSIKRVSWDEARHLVRFGGKK
jgi:3-dehydroquinate synthetase/shikimate kinase